MCLLYPHLPLLGTTPRSHWTLETWNILSPTCFDGSFCCKILMIFNICDPRVQSQHHGNSHLVGTISLGEYVLEILLHLKGNVFNCKRKFLVTPSDNDYNLSSRNLETPTKPSPRVVIWPWFCLRDDDTVSRSLGWSFTQWEKHLPSPSSIPSPSAPHPDHSDC